MNKINNMNVFICVLFVLLHIQKSISDPNEKSCILSAKLMVFDGCGVLNENFIITSYSKATYLGAYVGIAQYRDQELESKYSDDNIKTATSIQEDLLIIQLSNPIPSQLGTPLPTAKFSSQFLPSTLQWYYWNHAEPGYVLEKVNLWVWFGSTNSASATITAITFSISAQDTRYHESNIGSLVQYKNSNIGVVKYIKKYSLLLITFYVVTIVDFYPYKDEIEDTIKL